METYYCPHDLKRFGDMGKNRPELWAKFLDYYGAVFADGALWEARSAVPLNDGQLVEITGIDGLVVLVKPSARSEKA